MPRTELDLWNVALALVGDFAITPEAAKTVASATAANPIVCTSTAHGFVSGQLVLHYGFSQLTQVNGRVFEVNVLTANTYQLVGEDGSSGVAESTGGSARRLPTAKHVAQCFLQWPFARDRILRLHPWNCAEKLHRLARLQAAKTITGITQANPAVVTSAAHGYSNGDLALIERVNGMVEVNGRYHAVSNATANTYELSGEDSTLYAAYTSGGTARKALAPLRPDFGYAYRYDLPSDYLREIEAPDTHAPWKVVGSEVHSDDGPVVPMRYIYRVTDPARFDALLAQLLAAQLALDIAERLVSPSDAKWSKLQRAWKTAHDDARGVDGQEASVNEPAPSPWEEARL